jgi:CRISPR-associated protein Csd1
MLRALCDLYDRLAREGKVDVAPPGYSTQKISFKVVMRPDGTLFDVQDARQRDGGRPRPRQLVVPGGAKPTGAVTEESVKSKVLPLRGDSAFTLGIAKPKQDASALAPATKGEFEAFRKYHVQAEVKAGDDHFSTVCRFLERWKPASAMARTEWSDFLDGQGVFQVLGEEGFVHERPRVREWWEREQRTREAEGTTVGQCLVTGKIESLAELHEPKLKGIEGANTSGAAIVSFNLDAFESYGKTQSFNAPVSRSVAFRYATALNVLLDGPLRETHRFRLGPDTIVLWTDRPTRIEDIFARFCTSRARAEERAPAEDEATRQKLDLFLRALRQGRSAYSDLDADPEHTRFFLLALAGNAGRAVVRFFHDDTIAELLDRLRLHDGHCEVIGKGSDRDVADVPPLWLLLDQTCRRVMGKPDREKIPPVLAAPLLQAVLTGARYPIALYQAVLRRLPVEGVDHPRACVVKAILIRNFGKEVTVSLDRARVDAAYRLGRLFAALEKTQTEALPRLNRTIRDAYYGSASTAPATVFPRLLRTYQHHLSKLEGGWRVNRDRLVQEIIGPVAGFPAHLSLVDQGLFALGYYHQMRDLWTGKRAESEVEPEGGEA